MRNPLITLFALLILMTGVQAQYLSDIDLDHFTTLQSAGPLPDDFTILSSVKLEQELNSQTYSSKRDRKDLESFYLESNFQIEEMLHSGRILYGDPISVYLNRIKYEILLANPEIKQDIRIYTMLSNDVNAFTFDNGIVIVTTGLVSQVQNEAQIAYILCHEFVHYQEKHAVTGYVESKRVERGTGVYGSLSPDEENLAKFRYAKEQESEADEAGLTLYSNTRYSYDAVKNVFDILLYSYLPIDEVPFDRDHFNEGLYVLPDEVFLDTLAAIEAEEDYDDESNTHPNIRKRRERIDQLIPADAEAGRSSYILPEEKFQQIQTLARFQGCNLYLTDVEYEEAFYLSYILQRSFPDNLFLKEVSARALYGWAMYKNNNVTPDGHRYYKKIQGESQQVYHLFSKMNTKEFTILALREVWAAHLADPGNTDLLEMCQHLGGFISTKHELGKVDFLTAAQIKLAESEQNDKAATSTDSVQHSPDDSITQTTKTPTGKYEKIKQEKSTKEKTHAEQKNKYWNYAFGDYLQDTAFTSLFKEYEEPDYSDKVTVKKRRLQYHLGLDNLVVVDPVYISIDERNSNPVEYVAAEQSRHELQQDILALSQDLGMQVTYLDHSGLDAGDIMAFNDMAVMRRWIHESLMHLDEGVTMVNSSSDEIRMVADHYQTDAFAWMGVVTFTERESRVGLKIFMCIYIPLAPFLIYDLLTPDRTNYYFTLVANAKTGELDMMYYNANTLKANRSTHRHNLYNILSQINKEPKTR